MEKVLSEDKQKHLAEKLRWVWEQTLLIHRRSPGTRVASSLSPIEVFVTLYYGEILSFRPNEPLWEKRDRLIVSKGHGSISMYPILADLGFFDIKELENVGQTGSFLGAIPDPIIPGYETVNGSLGHGLGVACGIALALKRKVSASKVFVVMGDGELYEGAVWEAIMFAGFHKLNNLILVIDDNKRCMLGFSEKVLSLHSLQEKFESFHWKAAEIDGHDIASVYSTLTQFKDTQAESPGVIISSTIKGKGVPELESDPICHVKSLTPDRIDELLKEKHE